jgi:hypothetical protein
MVASAPEYAAVALTWSFHAATNKEEMKGVREEVLLLPWERTGRPLSPTSGEDKCEVAPPVLHANRHPPPMPL